MSPTISNPIVPPPQQYTTADGSIQGAIDGTNAVFTLGVMVSRARVYRNGILMTLNADCACSGQVIVFLAGQIPQPGDVITVLAS